MDMGGSIKMARYVVDAVVLEGRSVREVAHAHGVSRSWVSVLVARYRTGDTRPSNPDLDGPTPGPIERQCGSRTRSSAYGSISPTRGSMLAHRPSTGISPSKAAMCPPSRPSGGSCPGVWFVEPEPNKRPQDSFIRFEAALPNECWQADVTHWRLKSGGMVEILDFIDDHSRVIVGARVLLVDRVGDVVSTFNESAAAGEPVSSCVDMPSFRTSAGATPTRGRSARAQGGRGIRRTRGSYLIGGISRSQEADAR